MREYLEILIGKFDYTYIYASKNSQLLYSKANNNNDDDEELKKNRKEFCQLLVDEIQEKYKKYLLPFDNNIELFKSIINCIDDKCLKELSTELIMENYKYVENLYSNNERDLNKELEIKYYTNIFKLSLISWAGQISNLVELFNNKNNIFLLTNYLLDDNKIIRIQNKDTEIDDTINYFTQLKIFFNDENSYLSYIIKFINKLIKEEKKFDENKISEYLNEFLYTYKINEELVDEVTDIEQSIDYQNLIKSFNQKEQLHDDIENKINYLSNEYLQKLTKLKEVKKLITSADINDIQFYDNNTINFNELDYDSIKDYINYLNLYKNKNINLDILKILDSLMVRKSSFINVNWVHEMMLKLHLDFRDEGYNYSKLKDYNDIFDTIDMLSKLLNTELIKINYNDLKVLKNINLDNNKKYLICIYLDDKYEIYSEQDILYLEDKFKSDNFKILYINNNVTNNITFEDTIDYKTNISITNEAFIFINDISKYIELSNEEIHMFINLYQSKLFDIEDIFDLIFKNKYYNNEILNNNFNSELTNKFINYLLINEHKNIRIKK